jgi:hypothetical protein
MERPVKKKLFHMIRGLFIFNTKMEAALSFEELLTL